MSEKEKLVPISMEVYPKLSETAKKLGVSVQELVEWAVIDRLLYDGRFHAITRLYHGRNTELRNEFDRKHAMINAKIQAGFEKRRNRVAAKIEC